MSSEPFLARWSRRKQALRAAEQVPEDAVSPPAEPVASEAAPEPAQEASESSASADAELSPEEIARLPSLEDLTADTDISMFLRKGVPEPLRNAALRRMWSLDPKIRDFVCEAREYAYDWNTPGGVPGSGPLPLTEEVARMAARIVGGDAWVPAAPEAEEHGGDARILSKDREPLSLSDAGADAARAVAPTDNPAPLSPEEPPRGMADPASGAASPSSPELVCDRGSHPAAETPCTDERMNPASPRRHGGAMPL